MVGTSDVTKMKTILAIKITLMNTTNKTIDFLEYPRLKTKI